MSDEISARNIKPIDQGNLMNRKFTYANTAETTINMEKRGNTDMELFFNLTESLFALPNH